MTGLCVTGIWHFNSQPHKEADHHESRRLDTTIYFNSQPHKEADMSNIFPAGVITKSPALGGFAALTFGVKSLKYILD